MTRRASNARMNGLLRQHRAGWAFAAAVACSSCGRRELVDGPADDKWRCSCGAASTTATTALVRVEPPAEGAEPATPATFTRATQETNT